MKNRDFVQKREITAENQSQNYQAIIYLALSLGAASSVLPEEAIALSLNNLDSTDSSVTQILNPGFTDDRLTQSNSTTKLVEENSLTSNIPTTNLLTNPQGSNYQKESIIPQVNLTKGKLKKTTSINSPKIQALNKKPKSLSTPVSTDNHPAKKSLQDLSVISLTRHQTQGTQLVHTVKSGETVNAIAATYQIPPSVLVKENKIANPEIIHVNQKLVIPPLNKPQKNSTLTSTITPSQRGEQSVAKLRADVLKMQQEYQHQPVEDNSVKLAENIKPSPQLIKLKNDLSRLRQTYSEQVSQTEELNNLPELVNRPQLIEPADLNNDSQTTRNINYTEQVSKTEELNDLPEVVNRPQLIEPSDLNNDSQIRKNNESKVSMRQPTIPELPPLSPPEEYLPEAPEKTNSGTFDGYMWPAKGVFTSGYGWRWGRMHQGIDIAGPIGTPIFAAASGEVIYAGWNSSGFGNLVEIQHPDGSITVYAHNNRIIVRRGQTVEKGQQIAEMGSTGFSTGPHLHFEIHPFRKGPVNPLAYLP